MSEDTPPRRPRYDLVDKVQAQWGEAAIRAAMTPEELLNCAGQFLANVLLSIATDEAAAHEMVNRVTETNHLYINACWPSAQEKRDNYEEACRRAARQGPY